MPPTTNLDDPESVNTFLTFLRAAAGSGQPSDQTSPAPAAESSSTSTPPEHVSNQGESNGSNPSISTTPLEVGSFGSPDVSSGTRAPPSTPAFRASLTYNGNHLDTLPEVDDIESEKSSEATVPHLGSQLEQAAQAAQVDNTESPPEPQQPEDTTAALVEWANKSSENLSHSKYAPKTRVPVITKTAPSERSSPAISTRAPNSKQPATERAPNKELADKMKALSAGTEYQDTVLAKFRKEHSPEEVETKMIKVQGGASDAEEAGESSKTTAQEPPASARSDATVPFPAFEDTAASAGTQAAQEDRENLTYFSSWGSATPRDAPKSRVRTVVLTNLPAATDPTLVASLIHGGAIETMKVTKPTETASTVARVTFTTGDAADAYYAKYPNGIDFRFQGKRYTAFVEKGKDVDVVSGVMRGYLESGASRVVRATGADDDWGMRALRKLAEEKNRKVESINDNSREETRTITFRFTNIPDAVQFKSTLVRDIDWETCDIHFGVDPCEKATGAHFEN